MAAVLVAIGVLLYLRVGTSLNHAVDENLEARSAEVTRMAREGSISRSILPDDQDEQFAQLLDGQGRVIDATPQVAGRPTLDTQEVAMAAREQTWVTRRDVAGLDGPVRILARPLATPDGSEILLVGASLGERNATVRRLLEELFILGPLALLLASVLGYWLASAALKPVEAMRREAAGISAAEPGRRLPLPQPNDELRRLGETLNATFDQLEAALKLERSFVADAGHELRSPVSRLHTELELALRHPRRADELEDVVRSALAETRLLADLTENLLLLARSDHGALPVRRAPVAVDGMLETVAARYREQGARENRRVELDAPDDLVIMVDPVRMEQALRNMVENALVHGRGTVVLWAKETGDSVELHVIDDGEGFPEAFISRAFTRFARADEARTAGGAGLGLSIVDAIARAHGGAAHIARREGAGADVWIGLPAVRTDPPANGERTV